MAGQWSREAQDVLDTWLLKDVKGMQKKNMLALEDKPGAEPSCSEAVESQPKDDNIVEEDGMNETKPKEGKANAASSSSSSSSSSPSSSDRS